MCPEDQGLGNGAAHLGGRSRNHSSNLWGLYLGQWSLLELWGKAGCWKIIMSWEGLGSGMDLEGTESRGWEQSSWQAGHHC